jgi:hypothetical protein
MIAAADRTGHEKVMKTITHKSDTKRIEAIAKTGQQTVYKQK